MKLIFNGIAFLLVCMAVEGQDSQQINRQLLPLENNDVTAPSMPVQNSVYSNLAFVPVPTPLPTFTAFDLTNRPASLTNIPVSLTAFFERSVQTYQQKLSDTNLPPYVRETYERLLADSERRLELFKTNQSLWSELRKARESRDQEAVAQAKQKLANHLIVASNKTTNDFPQGATYEEVIKDYKKRAGVKQSNNRSPNTIRFVLLTFMLLPMLVGGFYLLRRGKAKEVKS